MTKPKLSEVQKLRLKINTLIAKVVAIQDACEHPNVIKKAGANTGNYCKEDDSYWYDCHCPDCQKYWQEDQ